MSALPKHIRLLGKDKRFGQKILCPCYILPLKKKEDIFVILRKNKNTNLWTRKKKILSTVNILPFVSHPKMQLIKGGDGGGKMNITLWALKNDLNVTQGVDSALSL